ncbi:MAG: hypothetical protein AAGI15_17650 [Pseudomonadota bacterium]
MHQAHATTHSSLRPRAPLFLPALLLAVALLSGARAANASYVDVYYEGTVTDTAGDGAGYSVGDLLSGNLRIDLSLLPEVRAGRGGSIGQYSQGLEGSDFVSGFWGDDRGGFDRVQVQDGNGNGFRRGPDVFSIWDRDVQLGPQGEVLRDRAFSLSAWDFSYDFVQGITAAQVFDLREGDVAFMGGTLFSFDADTWARNDRIGIAAIALSRFSAQPSTPTDVPSPGSIALLLLGMFGLATVHFGRS